jgi:hypothetical protein
MSWTITPRFTQWTPANITTALWLDAADASTITTVSGAVSQWNDKSGNGRHAIQVTSGNRPSVNSTGINNTPAISFNGSSGFLSFPSGFLSGTTNLTVAMILSSPNQSNSAIWGAINAAGTGLELLWNSVIGRSTFVRINNLDYSYSGLWSINSTPAITTFTASPTATAGFFNGSSVTLTRAGGISGLNYNGIYSMGRYAGGQYGQMLMGEFVILESSASANDRQKLEGYLAHKWGLTANLPAGHPYKVNPPAP